MDKPSIKCALLATLVAQHQWRLPMGTERLLSYADVETHEYFEAREVLDELRNTRYVTSHGPRGVGLNASAFGALANVLYYECNWDPYEIERRLKHYEGWQTHDWT